MTPSLGACPPELELLALLQRSRALLRSLFRSYGIGPEDAEDVLQDALLVVVVCWPRIDEPLPFLLGTVKHRIQAYLQRQRGERAALVEVARRQSLDAASVPQRRVDSREDARRLLARLPDGSRRIVAMRYGAGLSSREVARQLDRSEAGVRQSASRGLRRLRRYAEAIRSRR